MYTPGLGIDNGVLITPVDQHNDCKYTPRLGKDKGVLVSPVDQYNDSMYTPGLGIDKGVLVTPGVPDEEGRGQYRYNTTQFIAKVGKQFFITFFYK